MKKYAILLTLLLCALYNTLPAQVTTRNPLVENRSQSNIADYPIVGVLVDNEYTVVLFDYITNRNLRDGWISMSSRATLTAKNSNISLSIYEWGVFDEEPASLDFDEQYSVNADRKYTFYMVFPPLPAGVDNITIRENAGASGFFWGGIHVNNKNTRTSSSNSTYKGAGSGFFIDPRGYIATNYHVIRDAREIEVNCFPNGQRMTFQAQVVKIDKINDLAIIKIISPSFRPLPKIPYNFQTTQSNAGTSVFALGYPRSAVMGTEVKITDGTISASTGYQGDIRQYQISVPIQNGNSGGPLFDHKGNLVGIVSAGLSTEIFQNVNYAIKSVYLKHLIDGLPGRVKLPNNKSLSKKSLPDKVKVLKSYVVWIRIK